MARPNGFVLDTNILIALIRDNDLGKYIDRTYQLTFGTAAFYLPIVTHGEAHSLALQWHRYYHNVGSRYWKGVCGEENGDF